jgi:hypothetical protein
MMGMVISAAVSDIMAYRQDGCARILVVRRSYYTYRKVLCPQRHD